MTRRTAGFTLIELMIVLAIIGIGATLAIATTVGNRPRNRLITTSADLRLQLLTIRTQAVKLSTNTKICVFRDDTPTDATVKGRVVTFKCNSKGLSQCAGTTICTNAQADPSTSQWATSGASSEDTTCSASNPNRWCKLTDFDFNSTVNQVNHVSVNQFRNASGAAQTSLKALEITFGSNGFVDAQRSTSLMSSGSIELTNYDQCLPALATCSDFVNRMKVTYTAGGASRLAE